MFEDNIASCRTRATPSVCCQSRNHVDNLLHRCVNTFFCKRSHWPLADSTRDNVLSHIRKVGVYVERKPMHCSALGRATSHLHSNCANLARLRCVWVEPDTWKLGLPTCVRYTQLRQRINDQLLEILNVCTSVCWPTRTMFWLQAQKRVANKLTRAVICNVSAPLHLH